MLVLVLVLVLVLMLVLVLVLVRVLVPWWRLVQQVLCANLDNIRERTKRVSSLVICRGTNQNIRSQSYNHLYIIHVHN